MQNQTDWLKILCVSAMVLGFFGVCCGGAAMLGPVLVQEGVATALPAFKASLEAQHYMRSLGMLGALVNVLYSLALLVAPALVLRDVRRHAPLLRAVLIAGCVLVPLLTIQGAYIQQANIKVALAHAPSSPFSGLVGIIAGVFNVGWGLTKLGFLVVFLRVLARSRSRADQAQESQLG